MSVFHFLLIYCYFYFCVLFYSSCLKHLSYILPLNTLSHLYKSIIQPHIDYALTVFGNNIKYNSNFLQRLQNRAARIITHTYDYNTPSALLIKNLKWMTVDNRYHYFVAVTTFKALMGLVLDTTIQYLINLCCHHNNTISTPGYLVHILYLLLNQKLTI